MKYSHFCHIRKDSSLDNNLRQLLREANYVSKEQIKKLQANDSLLLVVSGGDGSLNHAINLVLESGMNDKTDILYQPGGTGNDFARFTNLDQVETKDFSNLVKNHKIKDINVGKIQNHYFINMVSAGPFAEITPSVSRELKDWLGAWSYYIEGLKLLSNLKSWPCKFTIDQEEFHYEDMLGFFVGNSAYAGGGVQVAPHADPEKNHLDLFVVRKMPIDNLVGLALELQKDEPKLDEYKVLSKRAQNISFEASHPVQLTIDGEAKSHYGCTISSEGKKIRLFLP